MGLEPEWVSSVKTRQMWIPNGRQGPHPAILDSEDSSLSPPVLCGPQVTDFFWNASISN